MVASGAKSGGKAPVLRKASFSHGIQVPNASAPLKRKSSVVEQANAKKRKTLTSVVKLSGAKTSAAKADTPYTGFAHPTEAEVTRLHTALAKKFGERRPRKEKKKRDILDTVVGTILSQNTTNVNSARAFGQLRTAFKSWDAVRNAKPSAVEASIKCGGLAPKKTKWIQHVLNTLHAERGKTSMEYLRKESKESVHTELERFPGIGKKTSAIINLFDVGHPDMAVDTHVFRYALQLGWVPTEAERAAHNKNKSLKSWPVVTRDSVYAHLDSRFPDRLKYSMHLILTDTVGGLPVICGASRELSFDGRKVKVDGSEL